MNEPEAGGRVERLIRGEDGPAQRQAMTDGFQREGIRRGALGGHDAVAFARLPGDPPGPVVRLLPDLPGGELTDGVVTLRPLDAGDIEFYTGLRAVPDVVATSVPPVPPAPEEVARRCTWAESFWLAGMRAELVIVDTATGTPTGNIGLFYQEPQLRQAMVGYSQLPAWRGKGYVARALQLLSLWVFAETDVARLVAGTVPENIGSQRVLERAGFRREAYLRSRLPVPGNKRADEVLYALLPEDLLDRA